MRAKVSVVEPGAAGTTIFTVRDGKGSCAGLGPGQSPALTAVTSAITAPKRDIRSSTSFAGLLSHRVSRRKPAGFGPIEIGAAGAQGQHDWRADAHVRDLVYESRSGRRPPWLTRSMNS